MKHFQFWHMQTAVTWNMLRLWYIKQNLADIGYKREIYISHALSQFSGNHTLKSKIILNKRTEWNSTPSIEIYTPKKFYWTLPRKRTSNRSNRPIICCADPPLLQDNKSKPSDTARSFWLWILPEVFWHCYSVYDSFGFSGMHFCNIARSAMQLVERLKPEYWIQDFSQLLE